MSMIEDGGPAYPSYGTMGEVVHEGKSLRDWFAGQALAGLLSNQTKSYTGKEFAEEAYFYADWMITARKGGAE